MEKQKKKIKDVKKDNKRQKQLEGSFRELIGEEKARELYKALEEKE